MSNLKLNVVPIQTVDWSFIEDHSNRAVAKATYDGYYSRHAARRETITGVIKDDNVDLSKAIYTLKETLPHGEFQMTCQQFWKLDPDKATALVKVGRALMDGTVPEEALKLLEKMEPRAAAKFLKADEETKTRYVAAFEQTGRVPSRRDFQAPKVEETKTRYVAAFESHEVQSNDRPNHQNELLSQVQQQDVVDVVVSQQPQPISQELEQIYLAFEQVVLKRHREIKESVEAINQVKALVSLVKSYRLVGE
jgi:hypothetical protein